MQIIGIAASKNAGKTSALNYIYGQIITKRGVVDRFGISNDGKLILPVKGKDGIVMSEVDISRDEYFARYASENIWQYVKDYNFGTYIKDTILTLYDVDPKVLWGTQEERDLETKYTWDLFLKILPKNMCPKNIKKTDKITGRQFIQYFADILRIIDDNCFTRVIIGQVEYDQCPVAIIGDVRRISELETIKAAGGKVIYLSRRPHDDEHNIENEFKDYDKSNFDAVIDNENMTIQEKNTELHRICSEWNLF